MRLCNVPGQCPDQVYVTLICMRLCCGPEGDYLQVTCMEDATFRGVLRGMEYIVLTGYCREQRQRDAGAEAIGDVGGPHVAAAHGGVVRRVAGGPAGVAGSVLALLA